LSPNKILFCFIISRTGSKLLRICKTPSPCISPFLKKNVPFQKKLSKEFCFLKNINLIKYWVHLFIGNFQSQIRDESLLFFCCWQSWDESCLEVAYFYRFLHKTVSLVSYAYFWGQNRDKKLLKNCLFFLQIITTCLKCSCL